MGSTTSPPCAPGTTTVAVSVCRVRKHAGMHARSLGPIKAQRTCVPPSAPALTRTVTAEGRLGASVFVTGRVRFSGAADVTFAWTV